LLAPGGTFSAAGPSKVFLTAEAGRNSPAALPDAMFPAL
jgi:hypothetical protein